MSLTDADTTLQDIPDLDSSKVTNFIEVNGVLGAESLVRDDDFKGEMGYTLVRMLRGNTVGRRLKRKLFKLGFVQLTCGAALSVICYLSDYNFSNTAYYDNARYGSKNQTLYYCVSYPCVVIGILSWLCIRYWGSLVTNRGLLTNLFKFYVINIIIHMLLSVWLGVSLVLTFEHIESWDTTITLAQIYPYYISTLIFLSPLVLVTMYYAQSIVKMVDEIEQEGVIAEPEVDLSDTMDLADVTFKQVLVIIFSTPFILLIQLVDFLGVLYRDCFRRYDASVERRKNRKPRTRNCFQRFARRMCRCFRKCVTGNPNRDPGRITPYFEEDEEDETVEEKAYRLAIDREVQERESRQRLYKELEEIKRQKALEAKKSREYKQIDDIEHGNSEEKYNSPPLLVRGDLAIKRLVLSVPQFKTEWSTKRTIASFETRILMFPSTDAMRNHFVKQGFHVVFAVGPTQDDTEEEIEIGICNIRDTKEDPWFLARFLVTPDSFSAVMKGDDAEQVAGYVKKFKVASVLKIATQSSR